MTRGTGEMKNTQYDLPCCSGLPKELQLQRMRRVMEQELTRRQRETLEAYYFEGLRPAQIARRQGVHRSTATRTLQRALHRLRRFLAY